MGRNRAQKYNQGQQMVLDDHREQDEMGFTKGHGVSPWVRCPGFPVYLLICDSLHQQRNNSNNIVSLAVT